MRVFGKDTAHPTGDKGVLWLFLSLLVLLALVAALPVTLQHGG